MHPSQAILICDRDSGFREALRNLLFAAGYPAVEVVGTVREGLARLRREVYGCVLIGIPRLGSTERRWAFVARRRQPRAKLLFVVPAMGTRPMDTERFEYVIKERAFSALLLLADCPDTVDYKGKTGQNACQGGAGENAGRGKGA